MTRVGIAAPVFGGIAGDQSDHFVGLSGRPELNSVLGEVTAQRNERGRYIVRVVVERREEQVAVKAENLRPADVEDGCVMFM